MEKTNHLEDLMNTIKALDKTNSVLKEKVKALYNSSDSSPIQRQLEFSKRREEQNRIRQEIAAQKNKSILNNVTFGFLTVDQNLTIDREYTVSCERLFGRKGLARVNLVEILELNERDGQTYKGYAAQVFEDYLGEEFSLSQLPSYFRVKGKSLRIEGKAIRDLAGLVSQILYTISDITELENSQRRMEETEILLNIIKNKTAFGFFLKNTKELLEEAERNLEKKDLTLVRRGLHTVKGNSYSLELKSIGNLIHEIENKPDISKSDIEKITGMFRDYLNLNQKTIGLSWDKEQVKIIEINNGQIEELKTLIKKASAADQTAVLKWIHQVQLVPASVFLSPLSDIVKNVALRLEKKVEFRVIGQDLLVDEHVLRPILDQISHFIRNSLDHGIESPEERKQVQKNEIGTISVTMRENTKHYEIIIQDDGRGIPAQKLVDKATQLGILTETTAKNMSIADKLKLIYHDGLSTAEKVSNISGRGVGMSSVYAEIKKVGGTLEIQSTEGQGTQFQLVIPK